MVMRKSYSITSFAAPIREEASALCPLLEIYSDMKHSYIVELKYAKYKDSESRVEELRQEAITQANRYADTETVRNAIGNTILHKIVVVYKGMDMPVCEEV